MISATAACNTSVAAGDCDNDGVPNAVEQAEGMNPLARDNDIFTIGRLFAMQQYRDFLGREGEPAGVQYWGTQVQSNAQTRAQVIAEAIGRQTRFPSLELSDSSGDRKTHV